MHDFKQDSFKNNKTINRIAPKTLIYRVELDLLPFQTIYSAELKRKSQKGIKYPYFVLAKRV
jgi:hypothetical protein